MDSDFPQTRKAILKGLMFLPVRLGALAVSMALLVASVPFMFAAIVVLLLPAIVLWILSPFVGLISPRAGHQLSSYMESATDKFDKVMDVVSAPSGWLGDVVLR